jgi:hypothetical protein
MSLESQLEDLQIHISQDLANSKVCVLERTYSTIKRTYAHRKNKVMLVCDQAHLECDRAHSANLAMLKP